MLKGLQPSTTLSIEIEGKSYEENAQGDGQFDAFMNALGKVYAPDWKRNYQNWWIMRCEYPQGVVPMPFVKP